MRVGRAIIGWVLLLPAAAAADAEDPICADRPGIATPTCTVPTGMVQVETTIADWIRDRSAGVRSTDLVVGETALKFGVTDRFHVELAVAPYARSTVRAQGARETESGFGDTAIAAKYRLTREIAPVQVAVRPFVKIPTARRPLGNGKVEGGLIVPVEYAIPRSQLSLTFAPELGLLADGDGSGHHLATAQVVSLAIPLSSRLSASAELAGAWDWDPAATVRQYLAGGSAAYLLSNDVQLDAGVNVGLNGQAPDLQLYSGFAFRF